MLLVFSNSPPSKIKGKPVMDQGSILRALTALGLHVDDVSAAYARARGIRQKAVVLSVPAGAGVYNCLRAAEPASLDIPRSTALLTDAHRVRLASALVRQVPLTYSGAAAASLAASSRPRDRSDDCSSHYVNLLQDGVRCGVLTACQLLHTSALRDLSSTWLRTHNGEPPLDGVAKYFGVRIGSYFAFMTVYTRWLVFLATAGCLVWWHQRSLRAWLETLADRGDVQLQASTVVAAGIAHAGSLLWLAVLAVWAGGFLKVWMREHSWWLARWEGCSDSGHTDVRRQFNPHAVIRGQPMVAPTGTLLGWREHGAVRAGRMLCITLPAMLACAGAAVGFMMLCDTATLFVETQMDSWQWDDQEGAYVPLPDLDASGGSAQLAQRGMLSSMLARITAALLAASGPSPRLSWWLASLLQYGPTLAYVAILPVIDAINTAVVRKVTDAENHRTVGDYDSALAVKLAVLHLLNNLVSPLYMGFVKRDLAALMSRLVTIATVRQLVIQQAQEVLIPMVGTLLKRRKHQPADGHAAAGHSLEDPALRELRQLPNNAHLANEAARRMWGETSRGSPKLPLTPAMAPARKQRASLKASILAVAAGQAGSAQRSPAVAAIEQLDLEPYDVSNDMLEMLVQWSFMLLFALVFPLLPVLALVNNVIEIRTDAWTLLHSARPLPLNSSAGRVWYQLFHGVTVLAMLVNVGIVAVAYSQASGVVSVAEGAGLLPPTMLSLGATLWALLPAWLSSAAWTIASGLLGIAWQIVAMAWSLPAAALNVVKLGPVLRAVASSLGEAIPDDDDALLGALAKRALAFCGVELQPPSAMLHRMAFGQQLLEMEAKGGTAGVWLAHVKLPLWIWLALSVALEHVLLGLLAAVNAAVPGTPDSVTLHHSARQALATASQPPASQMPPLPASPPESTASPVATHTGVLPVPEDSAGSSPEAMSTHASGSEVPASSVASRAAGEELPTGWASPQQVSLEQALSALRKRYPDQRRVILEL